MFFAGGVSYFTLRTSLILNVTIKDLYNRLIRKAAVAPAGYALDVDLGIQHEDRSPTHGYVVRVVNQDFFSRLANRVSC